MSWIIVLVWFTLLGYSYLRKRYASHAVNSVFPEEIPDNTSNPITITGNGFEADARAALDNVALPEVTWINAHMLKVMVPEGLPPGTHTLTITNPEHGDSMALADALFVSHVTVR